MRMIAATGFVAGAWLSSASALTPNEILDQNKFATVYLEVVDENRAVVDRGSGFIVSQDGFIVTVAHLKVDPTHKMWAVIGAREGTRFPLDFRDNDDRSDVAIWKLPQSPTCRRAMVLSNRSVNVLDRVLILGFPGQDGLTPARVGINNLSSGRGFYKADGFLRQGFSGGAALNEDGQVVAIVQGGTLPGTENNDLIPIAPAIALLQKHGARIGIDQAVPFDNSCFASCRAADHGVERWTAEHPWGPVDTGWLGGGHNQTDECNRLIAAALANNPTARIDLLPGGQGKWEESKRDALGRVEYKYFCRGTLRSGPVFNMRQSPACGLWN